MMKKSTTKGEKFQNNNKKINLNNSSYHKNTNNYQTINSSSSSSISFKSLSRKTIESNRLLSPLEHNKTNTKQKNLNSYKYKTMKIFSPNNNKKQGKELKKSILGKNNNNFNRINNSINLSDKIQISSPKEKYSIKKKIISNNNKEIPGLVELDKDMMKAYNINKKDQLLNEMILDKNNEFNYFKIDDEEGMTPLQKQEKLIKKLLRTKNYQKFIKKLLENEKICVIKDGQPIEFNSFNDDIYNYEFLDVYYKHYIPFIIMRPRLDVIRRKREAKLKKEEQNESKNEKEKDLDKIINNNYQDESQLTSSLLNKSLSEINNNSSITNSEKKEPLFYSKDSLTFGLTKIPEKTEENTKNRRLNIAFNKAKDAAVVVRRLEYSYCMRINILLNKPIYQKNAKIIQNWWKNIIFGKKNINNILKLQAYIRGTLIRKAFQEAKHTYLYKIPFLKAVDKVISRRKLKIYFDKLVSKCGILKLLNKTKPYLDKIKVALEHFKNKRKFLRENHLLFCLKKNKCCYTKEIFDWETKLKLYKIQAGVKYYLMHHNKKIIKEQYTNKYNPKLFYILKYGENKDKLKRKLKRFRQTFLKFKELKLKATLPGDISNKFLFFKYILRRKIFNDLLYLYNNSLNNKEQKYQSKIKMKKLLNHIESNKNKNLLKKFFTKWNIKANILKEYYKILLLDKLYVIEAIFRYQKKYKEKVFMLLLQSIQKQKKEKQMKAADKIYDLYNRRNGFEYENNLLKRILAVWKKNAFKNKFLNAAKTINLRAKKFLDKLYKNKLNALLKCYNIRNKIFKEKLKLWKFNSLKLKHHFNSFKNKTLAIIRTKEKLECLRKNFDSLIKRKKEQLRKYFNRFKTNTGVRKIVLINVQLCFFDENKEIISRDKYSMMKYIRNNNYINLDKIKKEIILKKSFDFWKIEKKAASLKRLCGKRISDICNKVFYLKKLKFLYWHKIVQHLKYDKASRLIQKNYRLYKRRKKKENKNIENNKKEINSVEYSEKNIKKRKRWKRYDRTIKDKNENE